MTYFETVFSLTKFPILNLVISGLFAMLTTYCSRFLPLADLKLKALLPCCCEYYYGNYTIKSFLKQPRKQPRFL